MEATRRSSLSSNLRLGVGCVMDLGRASLIFLLAAALSLGSCSGLPQPGGPPVGGNATFSLTLTDAVPANVSILSFKVTITGVTLNPTSGSPVDLPVPGLPLTVELTRLSSDTAFLGTLTVPAGTYDSILVTFSSPDLTFVNQTGSTLSGCANNTTCEIAPASSGAATVQASPFPLTLSANGQTGLSLEFHLDNAITTSGSSFVVDFTQPGVLTAANLPRGNLQTGQLDLIEDFTGVVTAQDQVAKTFTLQSPTRGSLTATANSSTVFDNFALTCAPADFTCVHTNQTLSVDAILNSDGTLTAKEIDLLDDATDDEVEGFLFSVDSSTQFRIAVTDKVQVSSGTLIPDTQLKVGNLLIVSLQPSPTFSVDTKGLPIPATPLGLFQGATDTAQLVAGQTVGVRVLSFTSGIGGNPPSVTTDRVRLRFTRMTGTVSGLVAPPFFNIDALPPVFGFVGPAQVQTFVSLTRFDGITALTDLQNSDLVSIRALNFLSGAPPLYAAKVRKKK
jgi:hypothetical protein